MDAKKRLVSAAALPLLLLLSTALVFKLALLSFGQQAGYLTGFIFYWLVWCLLVPRLVLGKEDFTGLFTDRESLFGRRNWSTALLWSIIIVVAVMMYVQNWIRAEVRLILLAIPLAILNGICEELLWRGFYVRLFPKNPWMGIVYPTVGFALWHFAPQIIFPAENVIGFMLSTLFLGLAYGWIAYQTGSARWTAISHSLSGIFALSGFLASSVLALLLH